MGMKTLYRLLNDSITHTINVKPNNDASSYLNAEVLYENAYEKYTFFDTKIIDTEGIHNITVTDNGIAYTEAITKFPNIVCGQYGVSSGSAINTRLLNIESIDFISNNSDVKLNADSAVSNKTYSKAIYGGGGKIKHVQKESNGTETTEYTTKIAINAVSDNIDIDNFFVSSDSDSFIDSDEQSNTDIGSTHKISELNYFVSNASDIKYPLALYNKQNSPSISIAYDDAKDSPTLLDCTETSNEFEFFEKLNDTTNILSKITKDTDGYIVSVISDSLDETQRTSKSATLMFDLTEYREFEEVADADGVSITLSDDKNKCTIVCNELIEVASL